MHGTTGCQIGARGLRPQSLHSPDWPERSVLDLARHPLAGPTELTDALGGG